MALLGAIFGFFCLPELKGRSFEEVEIMFQSRIPLRKFAEFQAEEGSVADAMGRLENKADRDGVSVAKIAHMEDVNVPRAGE